MCQCRWTSNKVALSMCARATERYRPHFPPNREQFIRWKAMVSMGIASNTAQCICYICCRSNYCFIKAWVRNVATSPNFDVNLHERTSRFTSSFPIEMFALAKFVQVSSEGARPKPTLQTERRAAERSGSFAWDRCQRQASTEIRQLGEPHGTFLPHTLLNMHKYF